jgi:HEAT repeat protein
MLWWDLRKLAAADPKKRRQAVERLGKSRNPKAVEPLIALLRDPDRPLREEAIAALGEIGDARAVEPLNALLHDPHVGVRMSVIAALSRVDPGFAGSEAHRAHVPTLLEALGHEEGWVRRQAATAAGLTRDPVFVEPLIAMIQKGEGFFAVISLGMIGDQRAVDPLLEVLGAAGGKPGLIDVTVTALVKIGGPRVVPAFVALLRSQEPLLAAAAAAGLGAIGDFEGFGPLWALVHDETAPPQVRSAAAMAIGGIRDERVAEPLLATLQDKNKFYRSSAIIALGKTFDHWKRSPVAPTIVEALEKLHRRGAGFLDTDTPALAYDALQLIRPGWPA